MDQLLEFIDHFSIDEKLYWRVPLKGRSEVVEIAWERGAQPKPWRVRLPERQEWVGADTAQLKAMLAADAVDAEYLERQIGVSVLTQAVFADMVLESARKIFGEDVVQRSIADTRIFLDEVGETARQMTGETAKAKAKAPAGASLLRLL